MTCAHIKRTYQNLFCCHLCSSQLQAQQTEKTIRGEFQKLYHFLSKEEAGQIDACRREAKLKSDAMNVRIINLTAEISELMEKIKTIEDQMRAEDLSFILVITKWNEMKQKKMLKKNSCYNLLCFVFSVIECKINTGKVGFLNSSHWNQPEEGRVVKSFTPSKSRTTSAYLSIKSKKSSSKKLLKQE